jgi:hypothetical protein
MLDARPARKLIDANAPENLVLLADRKAVGVDETQIDAVERADERGFVVACAAEQGDGGEGAEGGGVWGCDGACEEADLALVSLCVS